MSTGDNRKNPGERSAGTGAETRLKQRRHALVSDTISRQNKLWLVAGWVAEGDAIEWRWSGQPFFSRLEFRFPDTGWLTSRSYDDDVRPRLKAGKEG